MRPTAWRLFAIASLLSSAVAATRPHYGGTLRVQMKARITALEPAELTTQENLASLMFDRLMNWSESGQLQPALATSWQHDAEFKRWEFQLRPGVKFHDGTPLTASVVAAALEDISVTAQGDNLVIRSEEPEPKLLAMLASAGPSIWKRGADGVLMGTGPFRMVKWEPGRRAAFAANEDYWGGRPYLDRIEIEMGRTTRDQALDLDLNRADLVELAVTDARRTMQNGRKIWTSSPTDLVALVFSSDIQDPFREAIALSIDRASIHSVLLQKQGTPAAAFLPQWLSGYAFLFPDPRDVERARQVIVGISPLRQPLTIGYDPQDVTARAIAERIAVNTREIGITLRPVAEPLPASCSITRFRFGSPDADIALGEVSDEPFMPAAPSERYASERALLKGYHTVPLFHLPQIYGLGPRVRGWAPSRWGGWNLDSVWLAL